MFNDISSSSEDEEDEGDRHEDEDLNIMDTEDDLDRQLQDKLGESDSAQNESDRNNQIGKSCTAALFCAVVGKLFESSSLIPKTENGKDETVLKINKQKRGFSRNKCQKLKVSLLEHCLCSFSFLFFFYN